MLDERPNEHAEKGWLDWLDYHVSPAAHRPSPRTARVVGIVAVLALALALALVLWRLGALPW